MREKPVRTHSVLWKRLDAPGHDACTVGAMDNGWRIDGMAVFAVKQKPARFSYHVECNTQWQTQRAMVQGQIGDKSFSARIVRSARGLWKLNSVIQTHLSGCDDLDIAFTPATNTVALRRLALSVGEPAKVRAAWLNPENDEFSVLEQSYERTARDTYQYESPRFNFRAKLTINSSGIVTNYPKLWRVES